MSPEPGRSPMTLTTKIAIGVAVAVAVCAVVVATQWRAGPGREAPAAAPAVETPSPPLMRPGTGRPALVAFGTKSNASCQAMGAALEGIAKDFSGAVQVESFDVEEDPAVKEQYLVKGVPTLIFFDAEGHERFRHEGPLSRADILAKWKELGIALTPAAPAPAVPRTGG